MPGSKSKMQEARTLQWMFPTSTGHTDTTNYGWTPPANYYIALFTSDPPSTDQTTGTTITGEVTGGGYARQAIDNGGANSFWGPISFGGGPTTKTNQVELQFPIATADWGTIKWFAIMTASATTANTWQHVVVWGSLTTPVTVNNQDQVVFRTGSITISED